MRKAWQIASVAFIAAAGLMLVMSFAYAYHDRLGPGPGFFPFWLALITGGLAFGLLFQTSMVKSAELSVPAPLPDRAGALRVLYILVALGVVLALFEFLGFRISLFLFLLFLPRALGARNWLLIALVAAAGSFGIFHLFYYWLKVILPMGILGI